MTMTDAELRERIRAYVASAPRYVKVPVLQSAFPGFRKSRVRKLYAEVRAELPKPKPVREQKPEPEPEPVKVAAKKPTVLAFPIPRERLMAGR